MKARVRGAAQVVAALAFAFAGSAADAGTQLFKCVEGGRTVYQQQACPVSGVEPAASAAAATRASDNAEPAPARRIKPAAVPSSAPATPR